MKKQKLADKDVFLCGQWCLKSKIHQNVCQFPNRITEGIIYYSKDFCKATIGTYKNVGYRKNNITLFEFSNVSSWTPICLQINGK